MKQEKYIKESFTNVRRFITLKTTGVTLLFSYFPNLEKLTPTCPVASLGLQEKDTHGGVVPTVMTNIIEVFIFYLMTDIIELSVLEGVQILYSAYNRSVK